jgi:anti-anti-sigma factor
MPFQVAREGPVAIIEPSGRIDTRASLEFERLATGLFGEGVRAVVVDFAQVDQVSGAGLRVLLMMAQRLERSGGGLALCALSDRVRGVLDIAGLLPKFRIVAARQQAVAELARPGAAPSAAPRPTSRLTMLTSQVLAGDGPEPARPAGGPSSALSSRVLGALRRDSA